MHPLPDQAPAWKASPPLPAALLPASASLLLPHQAAQLAIGPLADKSLLPPQLQCTPGLPLQLPAPWHCWAHVPVLEPVLAAAQHWGQSPGPALTLLLAALQHLCLSHCCGPLAFETHPGLGMDLMCPPEGGAGGGGGGHWALRVAPPHHPRPGLVGLCRPAQRRVGGAGRGPLGIGLPPPDVQASTALRPPLQISSALAASSDAHFDNMAGSLMPVL